MIPLRISASIAYRFDSSLITPTILKIKAMGAVRIMVNPTRVLMGEPQPNPGIRKRPPISSTMNDAQGTRASHKLILPNFMSTS
jgi:hypothetical protein